jgi:hypothetical protein
MYGGHDDRFIALGIVLFSLWDMERRSSVDSTAAIRAASRDETKRYATYRPSMQEREMDEDYSLPVHNLLED